MDTGLATLLFISSWFHQKVVDFTLLIREDGFVVTGPLLRERKILQLLDWPLAASSFWASLCIPGFFRLETGTHLTRFSSWYRHDSYKGCEIFIYALSSCLLGQFLFCGYMKVFFFVIICISIILNISLCYFFWEKVYGLCLLVTVGILP